MIDEHAQALINGALDGELDPAEQGELDKLLQSSPEAQEYYAGLSELDSRLRELPAQNLPRNLHAQLINEIAVATKPARPRSFFNFAGWSGFMRYGLATAMGVLIGIGLYQSDIYENTSEDIDSLVGTVAPGRPSDVADLSFVRAQASGVVRLQRSEDKLVLDVELDASQPIEILFDISNSTLSFASLAQSQSTLDSFQFVDDTLRITGSGRQEFAIFMHQSPASSGDKGETISLDFLSDGQSIYQEEFAVPEKF